MSDPQAIDLMKHAATRAVAKKHPEVRELQDDGVLHNGFPVG